MAGHLARSIECSRGRVRRTTPTRDLISLLFAVAGGPLLRQRAANPKACGNDDWSDRGPGGWDEPGRQLRLGSHRPRARRLANRRTARFVQRDWSKLGFDCAFTPRTANARLWIIHCYPARRYASRW